MDAIYDRTILDVQRVKDLKSKINQSGWGSLTDNEKTEWINGMKGALNYSDLNRIESNLQSISNQCNFGFTQKTDWRIGDFPIITDYFRIRENTNIVRISPFGWKCTSNTPVMPINNYGKINSIEKILLNSYNFAVLQDANIEYIDEIYDETGQEFSEEYYADGEIICDDNFII